MIVVGIHIKPQSCANVVVKDCSDVEIIILGLTLFMTNVNDPFPGKEMGKG